MTAFPDLPEPGALVADFPCRHYPAWPGSAGGWAYFRVWQTTAGHLAIVTDLGAGVSVTNAAEYIHRELAADYPGELVLIEHYPPSAGREHATWDQVTVTGSRPEWRPLWPVPEANPDYEHLRQWVASHGEVLGIPSANRYTDEQAREDPADA